MVSYIKGVVIPTGFRRWYYNKLVKAGFRPRSFAFVTYQLRRMSKKKLISLVREYQRTHPRYYAHKYK